MKKLLCIICLACIAFGGYAQGGQKKLPPKVFVPKGQWIAGSSVSYSEHTENNYDFLVVEKINSDGYSFKLSPMFAYALKDNMALGGRFKYGRTLVRMDETQLNLDDENQFDINNVYQLKHSYSAMAIFRNYIPLGDSETQLEFGGSQSKVANGKGEALTGTYSKSTDLAFGVAPGMVAFINNYTAVEVSIGVLGVNLSKKRQVTNQVETGEQSSTSANFKINIFSIGLGIAFYL